MSRSARITGAALACVLLPLIIAGLLAGAARAGTWMQVSCVNPDGSAAPSEGWTDGTAGPSDPWAFGDTQCKPGSPMLAELADLSAAPANSSAYLQYQPPGGSTLVGGTVSATMSSDGYGDDSSGKLAALTYARLDEPALQSDPSDTFFQCVAWLVACGPDNSVDYSGQVALPADRGGNFYAVAGCTSSTAPSCDQNAKNNAWALAEIAAADFLLSSNVSPQGTNFTGSALQRNVRGTGHLVFTAAEPSGPGIYQVGVDIDGRRVWTGSPNTNGGACVAVGTDASTGALMFDHQQPCLTSEVVDVPVPTAGLPDGSHELAVTVVDAARNVATVLDQSITTSNPQTTPNPRGARAIHAQFIISWHWSATTTVLRSIAVRRLPRGGRLTLACRGAHCPRLRSRTATAAHAVKLLRTLRGRRFRAGDRLQITITARGHRAERVQLQIRNGRLPRATLLKR